MDKCDLVLTKCIFTVVLFINTIDFDVFESDHCDESCLQI